MITQSKSVKKFVFSNGEIRFSTQMVGRFGKGRTFEEMCTLWGCSDPESGAPLPYVESLASSEDLDQEQIRIEAITEEFEASSHINEGNARLARARNLGEFLNAYNF